MATASTNGIGVTDLSYAVLQLEDVGFKSLLAGERWGTHLQPAVTPLTYSFPGEFEPGIAAHGAFYGAANEYDEAWWGLSAGERAAVVQVLDTYSQFAALTFSDIEEHPSVSGLVGDLRFAVSDGVPPAYAHAYLPGDYPEAGDVWFSPAWYDQYPGGVAPGTRGYQTILHEIGHALGLKHPFDSPYVLTPEFDSMMYTVMSYSPMAGGRFAHPDRFPTTPMLFDVQALEWLYGPSTTAHAGNTVYSFTGSGKYWETITDSSGIDTLHYSSSVGGYISLVAGEFSTLGQPIVYDGSALDYRTVWLGPSAVIERAVGGSGADTLLGNAVDNRLAGGGGDDSISGGVGADLLFGNAGDDRLDGGRGEDTLTGGAGADSFALSGARQAANADHIAGFSPAVDTIWFDHANVGRLDPGTLAPWQYRESHDVDALGALKPAQHVLYDLDSGHLYYDPDGSGALPRVLVATLDGSPDAIAAADFIVF